MKILVTGGTGRIGGNLSVELWGGGMRFGVWCIRG